MKSVVVAAICLIPVLVGCEAIKQQVEQAKTPVQQAPVKPDKGQELNEIEASIRRLEQDQARVTACLCAQVRSVSELKDNPQAQMLAKELFGIEDRLDGLVKKAARLRSGVEQEAFEQRMLVRDKTEMEIALGSEESAKRALSHYQQWQQSLDTTIKKNNENYQQQLEQDRQRLQAQAEQQMAAYRQKAQKEVDDWHQKSQTQAQKAAQDAVNSYYMKVQEEREAERKEREAERQRYQQELDAQRQRAETLAQQVETKTAPAAAPVWTPPPPAPTWTPPPASKWTPPASTWTPPTYTTTYASRQIRFCNHTAGPIYYSVSVNGGPFIYYRLPADDSAYHWADNIQIRFYDFLPHVRLNEFVLIGNHYDFHNKNGRLVIVRR